MSELNNQLVLICGYSATGKTASLRNLRDQEKWLYLCAETGKDLSFKNKFKKVRIEDPLHVPQIFDDAIKHPDACCGIIIDSLTFLMDMFESKYVLTASDSRKMWGQYQQYFKNLMQDKIIKFNKPTLILAHTQDYIDETTNEVKTSVPIKGALKGVGIESFFTTVVATKRVNINDLENYQNDMLHITEEEELIGVKHVFQTRLTRKTLGERIRSPMGMFSIKETYIDNDVQILLDHIKDYYGE